MPRQTAPVPGNAEHIVTSLRKALELLREMRTVLNDDPRAPFDARDPRPAYDMS